MERFYELGLEESCLFGKDINSDRNYFLDFCKSHSFEKDLEIIGDAFDFCLASHANIERNSGYPYYVHPLKVAISLVKEFSLIDTPSIIAALLHDTVEDKEEVTIELLEQKFGIEVANLVDGLTKIKGTKTRQNDKASTYAKLFLALVKDKRVILIKLADRLDNMRTLDKLPKQKQKEIAIETLNFYTPFAQRLGLLRIKQQLEDLSLYFTDQSAYESIRPALERKRIEFLDYIKQFTELISTNLNAKKIQHILTIEHKHIFEIYKMIEHGTPLSEIDNFYSIVIILTSNDYLECYKAYGIVANIFGPVSSLDDYIARPKINLYRALHSTHIGPGRKLVEVIIRTEEMDKIAEWGLGSVISMKDTQRAFEFTDEEVQSWVSWMQDIIQSGDEDGIQKIWGSIKKNLYEDEIIVHTVDGEAYRLPTGACIIDLAYSISEDVGHRCISAKVNGVIKSLNYELNNFDRVEIITSPNSKPQEEWSQYVVTQKAIVKLWEYFKYKKDIEKEKEIPKESFDVRLKILGEDKPGMLNAITEVIGKTNIKRISLSSHSSVFEGLITLNVEDMVHFNTLFARLLSIKGIKGIERVDSD